MAFTNKVSRWIGAQNFKMLGKTGLSDTNKLAVQGTLTDLFNKLHGYSKAYFGSIPISVGYGMAAYDKVRE